MEGEIIIKMIMEVHNLDEETKEKLRIKDINKILIITL